MAALPDFIEKYATMQGNVQTLMSQVEKQDTLIRDLLDRVATLENQGNVVEAKAEAAAAREVGNITRDLTKEFYTSITQLRAEFDNRLPPPSED